MKHVDLKDLDKLPGVRLNPKDTFCFRCYPGIDCFNLCCRNLNLFLYPYDVVRLKHALGISSDAFIDTYVDAVLRPGNFFPDVLLRMSDDLQKTCPFMEQAGCSVYADRPDTCRNFPIEQGILYDVETNQDTPVFFFRPPDFCLGPHETTRWTLSSWADAQALQRFRRMTIRWAELKRMFQSDPWGPEGPRGPKAKMAFMATYNLDRFRDFVFQSSFLKRYRIKSTIRTKLKHDDVALLEFGFEWVRLFVWGIPSKAIKPR